MNVQYSVIVGALTQLYIRLFIALYITLCPIYGIELWYLNCKYMVHIGYLYKNEWRIYGKDMTNILDITKLYNILVTSH